MPATIGANVAITFANVSAYHGGSRATNSDEAFHRITSISGIWRRLRLKLTKRPRTWTEDEIIRIADARRIWEGGTRSTRHARRTVSARPRERSICPMTSPAASPLSSCLSWRNENTGKIDSNPGADRTIPLDRRRRDHCRPPHRAQNRSAPSPAAACSASSTALPSSSIGRAND